MMDINNLKQIISNRVCFLVAQGKSLEELESKIEYFGDANICWVGLGQFDTVEHGILRKINKSFDIVFDCASVPEGQIAAYEPWRIGRLEKFLSQYSDKLWITTNGLYRDCIQRMKYNTFWSKYQNQIMFVDDLFPRDAMSKYMEVPNSLTLCSGALIAAHAKKIVLFGCDGYNGRLEDGIYSYYMPEEVKKERLLALGKVTDPGINRDTGAFENGFNIMITRYNELFRYYPQILNCSSTTIYTHIPKITIEEARAICNE